MNTLLLYPAFPDTFWSFRHALKFIHKKAAFPPLGLLTVASMMPRSWPKRLIDMQRYAAMSIQFSRGCPFNCDFCNITALLGHRVRIKTAAQIIAELDDIYNLGWRGQIFL